MIAYITALILLGLALVGVFLEKAYFYVPRKELLRRAARGDAISAALADVAIFDGALRVLLIAWTLLTAAAGIVLFTRTAPYILGLIAVLVTLGLGAFWQPRTRLTALEVRLAEWCAPALLWLVPRLRPVLEPITAAIRGLYKPRKHTGIFEREDMAELLDRQGRQRDNRIATSDLERFQKVLGSSDATVKSIMVPRKRVVAVNETETINPILIDELHKTGHSYFPVYKEEAQNVVGVLAIRAVADVRQHGTVGDNSDRHLAFLHQGDSLEQALHAFQTTKQHLFIVLNDNAKYVGIVTVADVLHELVGVASNHGFDLYEDREKVARRRTDGKTVSQKPTEVIE